MPELIPLLAAMQQQQQLHAHHHHQQQQPHHHHHPHPHSHHHHQHQPHQGHASHRPATTTTTPPPTLDHLTDEQLARFTGTERADVLERIRFLAQVEQQVGGLVQQLTQYVSVLDSLLHSRVRAAPVTTSGGGARGAEGAERATATTTTGAAGTTGTTTTTAGPPPATSLSEGSPQAATERDPGSS